MSLTLRRSSWMLVGLLPVLAAAQAGKLVIPDFGDLAKKATSSVDITLDGDMLKSASHLMGAGGNGMGHECVHVGYLDRHVDRRFSQRFRAGASAFRPLLTQHDH